MIGSSGYEGLSAEVSFGNKIIHIFSDNVRHVVWAKHMLFFYKNIQMIEPLFAKGNSVCGEINARVWGGYGIECSVGCACSPAQCTFLGESF